MSGFLYIFQQRLVSSSDLKEKVVVALLIGSRKGFHLAGRMGKAWRYLIDELPHEQTRLILAAGQRK